MMKRPDLFRVFLCWTFLIFNACIGHAIENGKTPLNVDNPISGPPNDQIKDGKVLDTRYSDPPPEYYKGAPGGSSDRDRYDSYDLKFNGQNHRPFIPNIGTSGHINPYLSKHGFYGGSNINKDRISVNGYGGYGGGGSGGGDYSSNERNRPYGPPQAVDIASSANHGYYDSYENQNGLDWQQGGGYGGGGSIGGGSLNDKFNYLSKANFIPIAGAALLGIAAALIVNPVLLQLGTVAGKRRRRRRRDTSNIIADAADAHRLAYEHQLDESK